MDRKFILKMVQNCLKQYNEDGDSITLNSRIFKEIYNKIVAAKKEDDDLYDIVNDVVYGYITDSPYF
ncbi:YqzH family protein [Cytobacillus massiliigabonensis]|uniref:YqzH family protein n=1 Tax=Cytobacillus massiliigabonensis TaxID=1871011 RepID=UPI000C835AC8|nr:YqzH family protein [Cytobacillus massiliigabonensis]